MGVGEEGRGILLTKELKTTHFGCLSLLYSHISVYIYHTPSTPRQLGESSFSIGLKECLPPRHYYKKRAMNYI
jgi:hypothetical protein